jgi:hypothetical protein
MKSSPRRRLPIRLMRDGALSLVGCALALLASACGEDAATAKANFCKSLSDFSSTVMSYQALDPATATNDELNNAANDIENAWDDVVNEAEDWANADDNALTEAYDDPLLGGSNPR